MLRSVNHLETFVLGATDGEIGRVHSFLFDSRDWMVRYLVVDTGRWLPGRKVLIPPQVLGRPDTQDRLFRVDLTTEQVRNSPAIDPDVPISRQREIELHRHYGWTPYWSPAHGLAVAPEHYSRAATEHETGAPIEAPEERSSNATDRVWQPESSLHSTRQVRGYRLHATDGPLGHVADFIVSDENWVIRYLVVDTRTWRVGQRVLIAPEWVREIDWEKHEVWVEVDRQTIAGSPPYDPAAPVNREYEVQMYDYYGRPKYWT
jgi:hypothetical protein